MPASTLPYTISSKAIGQKISLWGNKSDTVYIINESTTDRIWVSDSAQISSDGVNGISVEPFTKLAWDAGQELYAILDSAATSNVNIKVTNDISEWDPGPVQVALATAAAIAAAGIVTADKMTLLGTRTVVNTTGQISSLDVSTYQSVVIVVSASLNNPAVPTANEVLLFAPTWSASVSATVGTDFLYVPWGQSTETVTTAIRVPVRGPRLDLAWVSLGSTVNADISTLTVFLYGSYKYSENVRYYSSTSFLPAQIATKSNTAEGANDMLFRTRAALGGSGQVAGWSFGGSGRHLAMIRCSAGGGTVSVRTTDRVLGSGLEIAVFNMSTTQLSQEFDVPNTPVFCIVQKDATPGTANVQLIRG